MSKFGAIRDKPKALMLRAFGFFCPPCFVRFLVKAPWPGVKNSAGHPFGPVFPLMV
jgi:hypothetical protein